MAESGLQTAGNEARVCFLQLFCAALFVSTLTPGRQLIRMVAGTWTVAACALSCLTASWWLKFGVGSNSDKILLDGMLRDARPLGPAEALLIGQAAVFLFCGFGPWRRAKLLAWPLLAVVILMQHRTAWVATGAMMLGFLLARRQRTVAPRSVTLAAISAFGVLLFFTASLGLTGGNTASALAASGEDDRSLIWRLDSWIPLLTDLKNAQDWLLGLPFGSGYNRLINGQLITVSPHNYYLQVLLRLGLAGLIALLLLYTRAWRSTAGYDTEERLLIRLLICGQLIAAVTYPLFPTQAVILGLLAAYAQRLRKKVSLPIRRIPWREKPHSSPASPAKTAHT